MKGEESSRSKGTSNATDIAGSFTTAQNVPVQDDYKCCFSTKLFNRTIKNNMADGKMFLFDNKSKRQYIEIAFFIFNFLSL